MEPYMCMTVLNFMHNKIDKREMLNNKHRMTVMAGAMAPRLMVTRFGVLKETNIDTYLENQEWKKKHNWTGAAYSSPKLIKESILPGTYLFVLEMHLTENKIKGIGLILNRPCLDKHFKIYNYRWYNNYAYYSKYRIDREELNDEELFMIRVLDKALFTTSRHFKRGHGIQEVPAWITMTKQIHFIKEFRKMFKLRWKEKKFLTVKKN